MIYIKSKPEEYGKYTQIEGKLRSNKRVLVIEDLISTGGSSIGCVEAVRKAGGIVNNCLAIFTYEMEKGKKAFEDAKCNLITLTNFSTLIKVASETGFIKPEDETKILEWNKDPSGWGSKHGFPSSEKKN
jgi:orotate phosphoribosyltransferase